MHNRLHGFVAQIQTDLAIQQIATRMAAGLERELRWYFPQGWRRWFCIALAIALYPIAAFAVAIVFVREWSTLRCDLDGWQRAAVMLKLIYMLVFAVLWVVLAAAIVSTP